jgi:glycosyltransferase involved in cell wall biosynthesis
VLGLVGQLKRKKGVVDLLEAVLATATAGTFHLAMVGEVESPVAEWLDLHADEAGLSWSIEPFVDRWDLLARYPAFDVAGLPSIHDGMPNVALEAAALGVPLLASSAGGLADLVEDGVSGVTFPAAHPQGLAAAVAQVAGMAADELARLGRGAAKAVAGFDHHREAAGYRAVLDATGPGR